MIEYQINFLLSENNINSPFEIISFKENYQKVDKYEMLHFFVLNNQQIAIIFLIGIKTVQR